MAKVKQLCEEKLKGVIEEMGYELVDVSFEKENGSMSLIFTIDKEDGVTIDDCEIVSKTINPMLDEINPTEDKSYTLVVSSPGLDRPLKTDRDFKRNLDKEIEIKLYEPLKPYNKKSMIGFLKEWSEDSIILMLDNKELVTIQRKLIAHIVPVIKF